jgi:hypothetical protein
VGTTSLTCADLSLAALYLGLLACLPLVVAQSRRQLEEQGDGWQARPRVAPGRRAPRPAGSAGSGSDDLTQPLVLVEEAGGRGGSEIEVADGAKAGEAEAGQELLQWPAAEQLLRRSFFRLGRACAARPALVLGLSLVLVGACAAGLTRLRCGRARAAAHRWLAGRAGREAGRGGAHTHTAAPPVPRGARVPRPAPLPPANKGMNSKQMSARHTAAGW